MKFVWVALIIFISFDTNAIDLQCDKVEVTSGGLEIEGTYSEKWNTFKNLIPDQNQTFMDDMTRVSISWSDSAVTIEKQHTQFTFLQAYVISRKDFKWRGSIMTSSRLTNLKGTCKLWEKPSDNAF
tara:strand:- start:136 stop:513 length:378 start_codon:yes stop_codon:yes gene_type:complete